MSAKKGNLIISITVILLVLIAISWFLSAIFDFLKPKEYATYTVIKAGSWNLENFGDTKANEEQVMNGYAFVIKNFDIMFVEEITDSDGTAFRKLCGMLSDYNCILTKNETYKNREYFGIIFRKEFQMPYVRDFYEQKKFAYSPILVMFNITGDFLRFYVVHLKPDNVSIELSNLEKTVRDMKVTILMGDFNADCGYYNNKKEHQFDNWTWLIPDEADTTTTGTDCAYDRIIANKQAKNDILQSGIWTDGVSRELSNHYPIWVEIRLKQNK